MELVSIIMPIRNAIPYLTECLDSIIQQTYPTWELLAVNDHSDDSSNEILESYQSKDVRIKCFQNEGKGIIDALNTGYSHAKGDFITRMDADDIMPVIKLEQLAELLKAAGSGHLSTGKVKYISNNDLGDGFKKYENWLNQLCDSNAHFSEIYKECVIPSPCWMMHRNDFESIGGFDSKTYPEDYDLCFRMYENQIKVTPSIETLHIWRDYGGRASRNDDNYSDNRFLDLKVKYFLRIDYRSEEKLIVWGAGKKGKRIAQLLLNSKVDFVWITNNEKKIGKHIYGKLIDTHQALNNNSSKKIILAVANKVEQKEIFNTIVAISENHTVHLFC